MTAARARIATTGPGRRTDEPGIADAGQSRLPTLDGLRGVAVMGIVLMNVNAFALPFAAYDDPAAFGPMRAGDVALWAIEFVLVDGKLRAIFSALFGASLLLVTDRAAAAGRAPAGVGLRRLVTLLLFGLIHLCLIWAGDILVLYALVGLIALPLRRLPVERLLVLAMLLLAAQGAILAAHYQALAALGQAALRPGAAPADVTLWRTVLDAIGRPAPAALARDLALHHGAWAGLAADRIADAPGAIQAELLYSGPETLGLMLLGMAGLRSGFLGGAWTPARYARVAGIAYAVALPPLGLAAAMLAWRGFPPLPTAAITDAGAMPFRWIAAIGHAALVVRWLSGGPTPLRRRIAAAGRVAFSNYLGTSLAMTALFDGWGLGLFGRLERWALLPIVIVAWAAMLGWSAPWLRSYRHGPLEWLWRCMARGRWMPFRVAFIANAIANRSHGR